MIRETTERKRNTLFFLGDQITDAAQSMDVDRGTDLAEVLAQAVNVDLHRVRSDLLGQPVKVIFQQGLGDNPPAAAQKVFQHGNLARREENRALVDEHLAPHGFQREIAELQRNAEKVARSP